MFNQEQIGIGLYEDELIEFLQNNYKTNSTQGYDSARDILYSQIDINENNNSLETPYISIRYNLWKKLEY